MIVSGLRCSALVLFVALAQLGNNRASAQQPTDAAPGPSVATPAPDPEAGVTEARRRYAQGAEFYRRGRYAEAVAEFTEAYSLWQNPTILFAIAQAYEGGSEVDRAIETYERYLATAPDDDIRRPEVLATIGVLRGLLATLHVQSNVPATVYVDGEARGSSPGDVSVSTGRHTIELRAEGYDAQSAVITIAGGTDRNIAFELTPSASPVVLQNRRFRFPRSVFFASVGATGVALATWGTMGSIAIHRARAYNDEPDATNYDREDAREIARSSNIALAVAGGLALTTTVIGVLTRWHDDEALDGEDGASDQPRVESSILPIERGAMLVVGGRL